MDYAKKGDRALVVCSNARPELNGSVFDVLSDPFEAMSYNGQRLLYNELGRLPVGFAPDGSRWSNHMPTCRLIPLRDPDADKADTRKADRKQPERIA